MKRGALKTVLEVITSGTAFLEKKGVESPRLNMEHLLAHILGLKRMQLYLQFDRPLGEKELAPLRELTTRRAAGVPLQHLLGTVEFGPHVFACDARALIPRPETEELVEKILARRKSNPPAWVLDLGCGSGVIGLTLAAAWPQAEVVLVDCSPDALALARENAARLGLATDGDTSPRVHFVESNLLSAMEGRFDVLAANLPYIPSAEIPTLSREVQHDPLLALDGGPDGLALIRAFLRDAPAYSQPGALLALEHGSGQGEAIAAQLREQGWQRISTERDLFKQERFTFAEAAAWA